MIAILYQKTKLGEIIRTMDKEILDIQILPTKRYIWYSRYAVKALTLTIVDLKDFIILYLDPYLVLQTVPAWVFASFPYLQTALAI